MSDFVQGGGDAGEAASPVPEPKTESEIVEMRKIVHFGQVLPMTDVEAVLDHVTSITRVPCVCRYISIGKTDKRYCFGLGYDPAGHSFTAIFRLCSENGLAGTCLEKTLSFNP